MKASVWGLLVAVLAFGASTIYLSVQLKEERAQAAKFAEATDLLNARIAELEKARDQRVVSGSFSMDAPGQGDVSIALPPTEEKPGTSLERAAPPSVANLPQPARTEAFQKMMRGQVRANNKRMYADVGQQLGLSKEDTSKLIDMLTDQQVEGFGRMRESGPLDHAEMKRRLDEANREHQAQIEAFLGPSKTEELRDYQATIPARQELDALTRQLEGSDAPSLSDDQQKRMLTALVEERKRIPMPRMSDSATTDDYFKAYTEWQSGYNERLNAQAQGILNSDQLASFTDYQQWQMEMREQGAVRRQSRGQRIPGGSIEVTTATVDIVGDTVMLAPAPTEEKPRKAQ